MSVHHVFTVPMFYYKITNWHHNKKQILDALPVETLEHRDPENLGLYSDYFVNAKAGHNKLPSYTDIVIDIIKPYLMDMSEGKRLELTDIWYQKYYKGINHSTHCHGATGWSAVIYVEYNPKVHHPTRFFSPFRDIWSGDCCTFEEQVEEGDMIIFPSSILHEAPANQSEIRRTIISYNLRGKVKTSKKIIE
tara:strand:+ start:884 stop:1459 length:576 start_codon:yes stop_codon:yes gene_type:complete